MSPAASKNSQFIVCPTSSCKVSGLRVLTDREKSQAASTRRCSTSVSSMKVILYLSTSRWSHKCQLIYVIWSPVLRLVNQVLPHTQSALHLRYNHQAINVLTRNIRWLSERTLCGQRAMFLNAEAGGRTQSAVFERLSWITTYIRCWKWISRQ